MTTSRFELIALALSVAAPVAAETAVSVPSGQELALYDVVLEAEGRVARFLFHAPGIVLEGDGLTYADVADDFAYLCQEIAVPALEANGWTPEEVVVSMADRRVEFGEITPEAIQFFEAFTVEDGTCIWRAF